MAGKRDIGGKGERHFGGWCDDVGITANPVQRDRTGWDYLIEFPLSQTVERPVPLDLQPKCIRGLVQVKASDKRGRAIHVKLDNWVRFVQESIPAFFVVIEYDRRPYPQRAYLVHVWEEQIRAVLRRLRESSANERKTPLHQQTLVLDYGEADLLESVDGAGFEAAVRRHVGDDPARYEAEKRRLIETVGYEDVVGELRARMILRADDPDGHLVDFALGRVDGIPLAGGEYRDVRFQIPELEPRAVIPEGSTLRGGQSRQDTVLRFRTRHGTARMKATVFSPKPVVHLVKRAALRARIVNPFLEMVVGLTGETECAFSLGPPDLDVALPLSEWKGYADFALLNDAGSRDRSVVDLRFSLRGREIVQRFNAIEVGGAIVAWARVIKAAWTVAERFGLQEDAVVGHDEFRSQATKFTAASADLAGEPTSFAMCLSPDAPAPAGKALIPLLHELRLGGHRLVLSVVYTGATSPAGSPDPERHCFAVTPTHVEVVGDRHLVPGEAYSEDEQVAALDAIAATCDGDPPIWSWWTVNGRSGSE
jgi:hypothetical protein